MHHRTRYIMTGLAGLGLLLAACGDETPTTDPMVVAFDVTGTPNKQNWKQCTNDHSYESECSWTTGNLTHAHNTYAEGDFVPKVLRIGGINGTGSFHVRMTYGFQKGGLTTHDFLGLWNDDMVNANPCTDGSFSSFCTGGLGGTLAGVLVNSNSMASLSQTAVEEVCGVGSQKAMDMAVALASEPGKVIIQGINVSSIQVTDITFDGCPATGDAEAILDMTVTPTAAGDANDILLLFGAHVARSDQWDNGGAAGVSGSPYHLGLVTVDGESAGSMDLQMSADAVMALEPAVAITIADDGTNEVGDPHVITATVTTQADAGQPFVPAPDGTLINFTKVSGPGTLSAASCTTTGGTGSCSVTLNSAVGGVTIVSASSTLTVSEVEFTVTTDGVAPNSDNLQKTWVDAKIAISPLTDLNPLGEGHTFTVTLMKDVGTGTFVAAAGETVTATQGGTLAPVTLGGTCVSGTTDANGQCTFTYTSNIAGTLIITASSTLNVGGVSLTRSTDGNAPNSGPATKTWGGAWITIGADGTNEVGDPHTFTVTVMRQVGAGAPEPVSGVSVTPTGDTGFITGGTCTAGGTTDASGQCTFIVDSDATGQASIGASANVPLNGTSIPVSTDGNAPNSGTATKTWVDAKIAISPLTDLNPLGESHTFTVTLMKDLGDGAGFVAAAGEIVTATQGGTLAPVTLGGTCTAGGTTDANGQCTFTYTSNIAGTLIITANSTLDVGGVSLTRSTDGNAPNSGPATKTWGGAWITIGADGTNEAGDPHTFTVTVMRQVGAGAPEPVSGVSVTPTGDTGFITGGTCTAGGTTDASGQCTIIVDSDAAGQASIGASANVPLNGTSIPVSTDGSAPNSGPAVKTWVDAKIEIAADATNAVGDPHIFTVTVWEDAGSGFVRAAGETVTASGTGTGNIDNTFGCLAAGAVTDANGECEIRVNSNAAGALEVTASSNVQVGGLSLARSTDGTGNNSDPATKTWVTARISIAGTGTNQVGTNHTFTVKVEENAGTGFVAASGETVSPFVIGPGSVGSVVGGTCTGGGTTDALGECTIIITSNVTGTTTMGATSTVQVAGLGVSTAINSTTAPFGTNAASGPAVKTWVDAKIAITPEFDANPLGEPHTFTVTLMKDVGDGAGFVAAAGETVTATQGGTLAPVTLGGTCTTGPTDASGQCTFTYTSNTPGSLVITAHSTLSVAGESITVSTDGSGNNSVPATKTWSSQPSIEIFGTTLSFTQATPDRISGSFTVADASDNAAQTEVTFETVAIKLERRQGNQWIEVPLVQPCPSPSLAGHTLAGDQETFSYDCALDGVNLGNNVQIRVTVEITILLRPGQVFQHRATART